MKLNHINLTVPDVKATADFFETFFSFTCLEKKGDNALAVLKGEDGFVLVITSHSFNRNDIHSYPDAFHVGFLVNSKQEVDLKYDQLLSSGYATGHAPRNMHGSYGFYFNAPGSILVEISMENK
ncbi:VOC family protein [Pinibacter aurantiacus]|uniref:VOC family protein n=1 Tax=Pinibacter aurantiacus TaxID=2851599 RepID=A0A9E2SBW9_9BACT|nr:VOC family protein [Pinibacter aurantiacus]MBV4358289.1 VOC family protein [Pinibacter aurantiacus]